jgi:FkbM family methyltransferase
MSAFNKLVNHPSFQKLKPAHSLQQHPLGFIDVGARGGAHELVEPIAALTAVLGFEPDLEEYERMLADKSILAQWAQFALEPVALADKVADATLHLLSAPTNHSLLPPNTGFTNRYNMPKWQEVGTWPLKTELMDTILFGKRNDEKHWGEFIKLDTQGTEYEILLGCTRMLNERTVALVTEVAFCELYKGQKQFSEIELLLRSFGFTFYGFHTIHSRSMRQLNKLTQVGVERAMYADAVFFKDPLPGTASKSPLNERQQHVLFVCALLLKYYDFALELAGKTWAANSPDELAHVKELINELSAIPCEHTVNEVIQLAERVNSNPDKANIYAGKFSDRRRPYFDYDDVMSHD